MRLMFDSHLDIAWNAISFDRDQTWEISRLREREVAIAQRWRGRNTVSLPELKKACAGVVLATVLTRSRQIGPPVKPQDRTDLDVATQDIAFGVGQGQIAYYRLLERKGWIRFVETRADLVDVWSKWKAWFKQTGGAKPETAPAIGIILSMEGCDPIVDPSQASHWFSQGLRTASLAHYGQSAYAYGTGVDGPLTKAGRELLKEFTRLGMILDVTHTSEQSFFEAIDLFHGPIFGSHNNVRALVPGDRQFSDAQIRAIVSRSGVIGAALDAWMLTPRYKQGVTPPDAVKMENVADHIDYICQLAGSVNHCAIGTDLDGGFGTEQTPCDLDTIADMQKLAPILEKRGYSDGDIELIFNGNWLRFFGESLPERKPG